LVSNTRNYIVLASLLLDRAVKSRRFIKALILKRN
jgi:hypothetical protein